MDLLIKQLEDKMRKQTILVTGAAGFIGSALSIRLLARGDEVVGIDNHNDYYDNTFVNNGAGVAVMFSKFINMKRNRFYKRKFFNS